MMMKAPALLAAAILASPTIVRAQSSSSCRLTVTSDSETFSKDAFVTRGEEFALFVCERQNRGFVQDTIRAFAQDTAKAVAKATVFTSINCEIEGDGYFDGSISGSAEASAKASAQAIYDGFVTVESCNGCTATADLLLSASEEAFVSAVAQFSDEFESFDYFDGTETDVVRRDQLTEDVEAVVIDVFVDVLIRVRGSLFFGTCDYFYYDYYGGDYSCTYESCFAEISTRTYDYDYPFDYEDNRQESCVGATIRGSDDANTACCSLDVFASAFSESINAFAVSALDIFPTRRECRNLRGSGTIAADIGFAVASTFADAFTNVRSTCTTEGTAEGCAITEGFANGFAFAFADAFADVFIDSAPCGCERLVSSRDDFVESFGSIFSDAFANTFASVCSSDDGTASATAFNSAFESDELPAISQAIISYFDADTSCTFAVESVACVGEVGPDDNNRCFDRFDGQKACPDGGVCVLKNQRAGFCFADAADAPADYDGTVLPSCPEAPEGPDYPYYYDDN